ncbi:uncharacterized protein LOC129597298 [Paramacrobiotus metropolitanus]|uniref:uncharacterized protein LOC129597298 n=1 Tax=Paramacrobiotus metropolitanus TaxID=2943436 RepID=UPI00244562DE|nr:uncharacterized protein LOC129597298 [Paramacrobiotus metropolitanus]
MLELRRCFVTDRCTLFVLSIVEILLAVLGFSANLYSLFYGALFVVNSFPIAQFLAFILSIPVYGFQLVNGCCLTVCCIRVFRGNQDPADFGKGHDGRCTCLVVCCIFYLVILIGSGLAQFTFRAEPFVKSLGVWGSIHHVFQVDLAGQLVLLGTIALLVSAIVVAMSMGWRSAVVYHELECVRNQEVLFGSSESENVTPAPYKDVLIITRGQDFFSTICTLPDAI